MPDEVSASVAIRYEALKRLLGEYTSYMTDLPVKPQRGGDLGPAFEKCVLEARFIFPGLTAEQQEQIAIVRLAGMNILARYLMARVSTQGLAECGLCIDDKAELDRVTKELEADFSECKRQIVSRGIIEGLTGVQKMFWEEWLNPFRGLKR